jgi:nitronate monooxygenase
MKFNLWLVILLALGPIFILFAGLSAAGGFASSVGWEVMGILIAASLAAGYLATRGSDKDIRARSTEATSDDAIPTSDVSEPAPEREMASAAGYSSPPCFLHELDPSYLGYSSREDVLALLNLLLESERAGVRGVRQMSEQSENARARTILREIASDEAGFCAMLFHHITRLGDMPSRRTGAFDEKLNEAEAFDDQLALLNRGQSWVVQRLREAIPRIADDLLRADLQEMLETHEHNIERCARLRLGPEALVTS